MNSFNFQFVYDVLPEDPFFVGHFPTFPLLPGVAQIDKVVNSVSSKLGKKVQVRAIKKSKFTFAVRPGQSMWFDITVSGNEILWKATVDGQQASSGCLMTSEIL